LAVHQGVFDARDGQVGAQAWLLISGGIVDLGKFYEMAPAMLLDAHQKRAKTILADEKNRRAARPLKCGTLRACGCQI
jgi:hypothetical protein